YQGRRPVQGPAGSLPRQQYLIDPPLSGHPEGGVVGDRWRPRPRAVLDLRSYSQSHPAAIGLPTLLITAPTRTWRLLRTHPADRHLTTHRTYESDRTQAKSHN